MLKRSGRPPPPKCLCCCFCIFDQFPEASGGLFTANRVRFARWSSMVSFYGAPALQQHLLFFGWNIQRHFLRFAEFRWKVEGREWIRRRGIGDRLGVAPISSLTPTSSGGPANPKSPPHSTFFGHHLPLCKIFTFSPPLSLSLVWLRPNGAEIPARILPLDSIPRPQWQSCEECGECRKFRTFPQFQSLNLSQPSPQRDRSTSPPLTTKIEQYKGREMGQRCKGKIWSRNRWWLHIQPLLAWTQLGWTQFFLVAWSSLFFLMWENSLLSKEASSTLSSSSLSSSTLSSTQVSQAELSTAKEFARKALPSGESSREREQAPPSRARLFRRMRIQLWLFCRGIQGAGGTPYSGGLATWTGAPVDPSRQTLFGGFELAHSTSPASLSAVCIALGW